MTGWSPTKVLYFGDHSYADLADLSMYHGWRTCAIIEELEEEIDKANHPEMKIKVKHSIGSNFWPDDTASISSKFTHQMALLENSN